MRAKKGGELRLTQESAAAKLKALRTGDWDAVDNRSLLTKERMMDQIRRKLRDLIVE